VTGFSKYRLHTLQGSMGRNIFDFGIFTHLFMPVKRINQIIMDLPFEKKLLGAGSLLMAISVFLPWYEDRDSFNIGDVFLGVTGPLYLVGLTVMTLAIMNIVLIAMDSTGRKIPFGNLKTSSFFLTTGLVSFYLLMVVNSVYFHNKFGVNITLKQSQFGMFTAFISASLMTIGGYLATRERTSILKEFQQSAQESLIKIPDQQDVRRPKENLRNMNTAPVAEPITQTQISEPEEATPQKSYQSYRSDL
jgi:hypothetical protein